MKVIIKERNTNFIFCTAKIFLFTIILIFNTIHKTQAACNNGEMSCGADCCASLDENGVLTISGSGAMADYTYKRGSDGNYGYFDENNNPNPLYNNTNIKAVQFAEGSNITRIGTNAFYNATNLSSVSLPNTITSIGATAFENNKLTSVIIPDSVTDIGNYAFAYNRSIESVTIPDSVTTIGDGAFTWNNLSSIVIPDSVTSIGSLAFYHQASQGDNYNHTEIIVPDTVENVGAGAFGLYSSEYAIMDLVCRGSEEACSEMKEKLKFKTPWNSDVDYRDYISSPRNPEECEGGMYEWDEETSTCHRLNEYDCNNTADYYYNGNACSRRPQNGRIACASSYKARDGYCDRIKYTPTEASTVLHDDDTNEIIITFKK